MTNEVWKDIKFIDTDGTEYDYTGLYQVSNMGRVKIVEHEVHYISTQFDEETIIVRKVKEKIKKFKNEKNGYVRVELTKDGESKFFAVHRLVAYMFIENDDVENKVQVNHIDEDKSNNTVENLEWCTAKYNTNYGTRNERVAEKLNGREVAEETRKKISEKAKGRKVSDKARVKASETCKARIGEKHPMYGKFQSEEAKRKMSDNSTSKRQVVQTTLDGEFIKIWNSITEVTKTLGIDGSSISKVCRGKSSYAKGYKWYYLKDYESLINE